MGLQELGPGLLLHVLEHVLLLISRDKTKTESLDGSGDLYIFRLYLGTKVVINLFEFI